jgi:hypothetical protein
VAIACVAGIVKGWPLAWPFVALTRIAWCLALLAYAVAPVLAIGGVLARWLFHDLWESAPAWRVFLAWAGGWGVVAAAGTALLAAGLYSETAWSAVAAFVNLVIVLLLIYRRWEPIRSLVRRFGGEGDLARRVSMPVGWSWVLLGLLAVAFLAASGPPVARDEVTYHLVVPRLWQFQGGWNVPTDNLHWLFPAATEVAWGYGFGVGGSHVPRLLTFAFGLMTVGMAWRWLVDEGFDAWTVRTSLVFLVAAPLTTVSLAMCNVEWPLVFYLFLGWWGSRRYLESCSGGSARLVGLAWGMALGTKYTAYPAVGLLFAESLGRLVLRRKARAAVAHALWFAVGATVFAVPWLVRNLRLTGDPFYPLGVALGRASVPGASSPPAAAALLEYAHLARFWRLVPWLYHATADTVLDHRLHLGWPLLLAAVALLGWRVRASRPWFAAVGASLALVAFSPAPRAYLAPLALAWLFLPNFIAPLAASRSLRAGTSAVLAVFVVSSVAPSYLSTIGSSQPVQEYLLGIKGEDQALRQAGFLSPAVRWVRDEVPPDGRLWVWGDEQVFYLARWARASSYLERPRFLTEFERLGPEGFSRLLEQWRIGFVVVNRNNCPPPFTQVRSEGGLWSLRPELEDAWRRWAGESLREVARDQELVVFRVIR